jgi:hypothetical protein
MTTLHPDLHECCVYCAYGNVGCEIGQGRDERNRGSGFFAELAHQQSMGIAR